MRGMMRRAPSAMLRMVPLPRFAGEELAARPTATWILPRLRGRILVADGLAGGSSPAKRGRGTMRSIVEGAH